VVAAGGTRMSKADRGEPIVVYSEARGEDVTIGYRNEWDVSGEKSRQQHQATECADPEVHDCPGCEHRPDCAHCAAVAVGEAR